VTVIAAAATDDGVVMGCDSAANYSGTAVYMAGSKVSRLTSRGGTVLLGVSGWAGMLPTIERRLTFDGDFALPTGGGESFIDGWAQNVAEQITGILADSSPSFIRTADTAGAAQIDGVLLMGWNRYLWIISTHSAVRPRNGVAAIGSGADIALGAIHTALDNGIDPTDAVRRAVELAALYDSGCGLDDRGPLIRHTTT
jgi:ATP-dependent protease HslVU (ClpYQ) peptidase subunit